MRFSAEELAQCGGFHDTQVVRDAWNLTRTLADALDATFAVFQCPPSFAADEDSIDHLKHFFHWASRGRLRFVWEPRHSTWTPTLVGELCRELDLIHAVDAFEQESVFGEPHYYRLHGAASGNFRYEYDHPYSDDELQQLQQLCAGVPTDCFFNNKQMSTDAVRFEKLVESAEVASDIR